MSSALFACFYVLGVLSAGVAAFAVPEAVVRLNWWLRGYDMDTKR